MGSKLCHCGCQFFSNYSVKTIAVDNSPKISMGGVKASIDYCFGDYRNFDTLAAVILPGGLSWEENNYDEIAEFIGNAAHANILVAAICGAATFLCRHGFLDHVRHTGDSLELFQSQRGYHGQALYVPAQVVSDGCFITAQNVIR